MYVQAANNQYGYSSPIHDVGLYLSLGFGLIWDWINVVLSFRTCPQLSSRFLCWLRVFLVFSTTVITIAYPLIPVFVGYFLAV